jgi:hypothetical protein
MGRKNNKWCMMECVLPLPCLLPRWLFMQQRLRTVKRPHKKVGFMLQYRIGCGGGANLDWDRWSRRASVDGYVCVCREEGGGRTEGLYIGCWRPRYSCKPPKEGVLMIIMVDDGSKKITSDVWWSVCFPCLACFELFIQKLKMFKLLYSC